MQQYIVSQHVGVKKYDITDEFVPLTTKARQVVHIDFITARIIFKFCPGWNDNSSLSFSWQDDARPSQDLSPPPACSPHQLQKLPKDCT